MRLNAYLSDSKWVFMRLKLGILRNRSRITQFKVHKQQHQLIHKLIQQINGFEDEIYEHRGDPARQWPLKRWKWFQSSHRDLTPCLSLRTPDFSLKNTMFEFQNTRFESQNDMVWVSEWCGLSLKTMSQNDLVLSLRLHNSETETIYFWDSEYMILRLKPCTSGTQNISFWDSKPSFLRLKLDNSASAHT